MNREILRLAIPNIISNISVPLLGLVDLALMGHLESEVYIGAIALGGVIFNFIYWGFSFLRMSSSGFTAQALGEKNETEIISILIRALIISAIISIFIWIVQTPIAWMSFKLIGGSSEVESLAREYFHIRVWAAPATLGMYVFSGWFLGMQNSRYPMIIAIVSNVLNIGISAFFVFGLKMKSDGVAWGTVLAQYAGILLSVLLLLNKYKKFFQKIKIKNIYSISRLSSFFKVNIDIFIRTFCIIMVFTFFTSKSASINDTILAVNSLLLQFLLFFAFFIDGFAFAGEALVGKFFGAKKVNKIKIVTRLLFIWGTGLAVGFTFLYFFGANTILNILTSQTDVVKSAQPYLFWVTIIPLTSFGSFIWDGIFIGATASKAMRNALLAATILVFTPVYFSLNPLLHNHALWMGMTLFMLSRGIFQTLFYKKAILNPN